MAPPRCFIWGKNSRLMAFCEKGNIWLSSPPASFWMGQVHVCAVAAREAGAGREGPCSWWDACTGGTTSSPGFPVLLCTRLDEARSSLCDLPSLLLAVTQLIAAKRSSEPSVGGSCSSASKPFHFPAAASGLRASWSGVKGGKKKNTKKPNPRLRLGHLMFVLLLLKAAALGSAPCSPELAAGSASRSI